MHLGSGEITLIVLAAVLLFGVTKIPQLFKGVGQGIKEFKDAIKEDDTAKPGPGAPTEPKNPDATPKT